MISEEIFRVHIEKKKMQLIQEFPTKIKIDKIKIIEHTKRVVKLCEEFATELENVKIGGENIKIDRELLIHAAWLHDIAKFDDKKNHNSQELVIKILDIYNNDITDVSIKDIAYVVSFHNGKLKPIEHVLESAILRICDKLDRFNKGKDDAEEKCNKSINKISEWAEREKWLDDFKRIYLAMREDIEANVLVTIKMI